MHQLRLMYPAWWHVKCVLHSVCDKTVGSKNLGWTKKGQRSCWISAAVAAGVIAGPTFWNKENFNRVSKLLLFQFFLQLTDQWVTWPKSDFNCSTIGFCYEVKRSGDLFCPLLIILMNDNIFLYGLIMFNKETINAWRQDMLTLWNVKSVQSAGTQTLAQQELVTEKSLQDSIVADFWNFLLIP